MKAPLSEGVARAACLGFALWTLCAHAVVFAGGSLTALMALFAVSLAVLAGAWTLARRRGRLAVGSAEDAHDDETSPGKVPEEPAWWRAACLVVALAAGALGLAWGDPRGLWGLWMGVLAVAAALFVLREPVRFEAPARSRTAEAGLWGLAALCALYALCVHRPDADDSFYVNIAVAAIDLPDLPLLARDTLHGRFDLPIHYPAYRLHSWELWNAALARLTGLPAVAVFHFVSTALVAMLVPLCHAVLFRRLTPGCWAWTTLAFVIVLAAPGETHRWYGNFAFVRMWQGKAVFLFAVVPLVYAWGIRFARKGDARSWLLLAAAQIAGLGATSSALWAAPVASLVAMSSVLRPARRDLTRLGIGALASFYPLAAGLLLKQDMAGAIPEVGQSFEAGEQLGTALLTVLGDGRLHAVCVLALFAAFAATRGLARRFAIVAPLAVGLVLLNPWLDAFVRANLSGPSYWRVFWALPVPILLALVAVAPLALRGPLPALGRAGAEALRAAGVVALLAAFVGFVPAFYGFDERNERASFGWPRLKLPDFVRWSRTLNDIAPRQRVVAPPYISAWIPLFHDHAYPLSVRVYLRPLREQLGETAFRDRVLMTFFAEGSRDHPDAAAIFERGLDLYDVQAVCLRTGPETAEARAILRRQGFMKRIQATNFEIWARPGLPGAADVAP